MQRVNMTWIRATYHSDSQLQTQGSPADYQGKHPKQAHPAGDRQMADVEALISSRSFHKMYYLESEAITKSKELSTTLSSEKPFHFMCHGQQRPEKFMSSCWFPHYLALGLQGKEGEGGSKVLTLLLAGKPKAQRHRGGCREAFWQLDDYSPITFNTSFWILLWVQRYSKKNFPYHKIPQNQRNPNWTNPSCFQNEWGCQV